jgi:hypothetical protein
MLILKYFLTVGTALAIGLFALSSYMESEKAASRPRTHTTATLAVPPPPPKPAVAAVSLIDEQIAPPPGSLPKSSRPSNPQQRR